MTISHYAQSEQRGGFNETPQHPSLTPNHHLPVCRKPAAWSRAFPPLSEITGSQSRPELTKAAVGRQTDKFQKRLFCSFPLCKTRAMHLFQVRTTKTAALGKKRNLCQYRDGRGRPVRPSVCPSVVPTPVFFYCLN